DDVHREINGALRAIHALQESGLKRRGWSKAQSKIWQGVCGARSAAHHKGETVIALRSWEGEDRLRWKIDKRGKSARRPNGRRSSITSRKSRSSLSCARSAISSRRHWRRPASRISAADEPAVVAPAE